MFVLGGVKVLVRKGWNPYCTARRSIYAKPRYLVELVEDFKLLTTSGFSLEGPTETAAVFPGRLIVSPL